MNYRAFVSSTFEDLKEHRTYAIGTLRKAGFSVDPMEDWTAASSEPKQLSRARVEGCHLCILLVAFRRGYVPEGERSSITQMEYETAKALGIDTLVFLLDERAPWFRPFDELEKDPELRRWRAQLMAEKTVNSFSLAPDSIDLAAALNRWLQGAGRRADERIASGLERERQLVGRPADDARRTFINAPPFVAPAWFQDRHVETGLIADFLKDDAMRLLMVVGRAGIGKTAMVCRLLRALERDRLPDDLGTLDVDGIVYLSATGSRRVTLPQLFADLCKLLPEDAAASLEAIYRNAQSSAESKMQALLEAFPSGRHIVLLDNFEDVLDRETGEIRDRELDEALRALLTLPEHGVKVILTTQVAPRSLQLLSPGRQRKIELDKGLESPYAENILRSMDADGTAGLKEAPAELLALARERTRGYPRALEALAAILTTDRETSLQEVLSNTEHVLPEHVVRVLVGEAYSRLDAIAQHVMQALALFAYPVPPTAVDYLLQPYEPGIDATPVLRRLVTMHFVRREGGNFYLHPIDGAYARAQVPEGDVTDWQVEGTGPYTRARLTHRGAEYFRMVRRDRSTWITIEDLKPLTAEFDLLCASHDYEAAWEVLDTVCPFLERWGHYRQAARLADRLAREAGEPVRSAAQRLAGQAHFALGEVQLAIEYLEAALEALTAESDSSSRLGCRLALADCYAELGDHESAALQYQRVLERAPEDHEEFVVQALVGLGRAEQSRHAYGDAEHRYAQALQGYIPQDTPGTTAPVVADPSAWRFVGRDQSPETSEASCVYAFGASAVESGGTASGGSAGAGAPEAAASIEIVITPTVPEIWMALAELYARTDRVSDSMACSQLALEMFGALDVELGVARALGLLRGLVVQVPEADAAAIRQAQEEMLGDARKTGNRRLEIALLNDLVESYLERNDVNKAEALYRDLSMYATALEDPMQRMRAEIGFARIEWARGNAQAAAATLEALLKQGVPDLQLAAEVQYLLANIENSRGRRSAAMDCALAASRGFAALRSTQAFVQAERLLASLAIQDRQYDEAVRKLESAAQFVRSIGVPSVISSVFCDLAKAYVLAGARTEALRAVDEAVKEALAIELPLSGAEALNAIGEVRFQLREFERAEAAYRQAKDLCARVDDVSGQISVLHALSSLYHETHQVEARLAVVREAATLAERLHDPDYLRMARMQLALALSDSGEHGEAVARMKAAVNEDPDSAWARGSLGWVLYQAGDYDRALDESRRALERDAAGTWILQTIAHCYLAKGCPDDAEREYRRFIEGRKGGENFVQVINEVKALLSRRPDTPQGAAILQLLEEQQRTLDAEGDTGAR